MDVFTASFFGHRRIDNMSAIEEKLNEILCDIIENNNFVEFLVGREGDFDIIVASVIRRVTKRLDRKNSVMTLVLPYMKSDYQKNSEHYLNYYDEVEICTESANVHYKAAIQHRNKSIIDRSDFAVFYVERDGGAYKTMKYAEKSNCRILRLNKSVSNIE